MKIFHPQADSKALTAAGRPKPRSVSMKTLSATLKVEEDPVKRELLQLVLEWLNAKAVAKRGGFVALGELRGTSFADTWRSATAVDGVCFMFLPRLVSALVVLLLMRYHAYFERMVCGFCAPSVYTTRYG